MRTGGLASKQVRGGLLLTISLIAAMAGAVSAKDIKVEPLCPATVVRGTQLQIDLRLTNQKSVPITIAKSGLAAHVGNLNVVGPVVLPLAGTLQPFQSVTVPGYLKLIFPQEVSAGTFVSFGVGVFGSVNNVLGAGGCLIEVK